MYKFQNSLNAYAYVYIPLAKIWIEMNVGNRVRPI